METPTGTPVNESLLRHYVEEDSVVRAYVRAMTRGHREADDVIQEIWRVVCQKISDYDPDRPFRPWVLGITRLQVLKWRQMQARSREVLAPDVIELLAETAEELTQELDLRQNELRECLQQMPPHSRQLLELAYEQRLTHAAIASRLGRTLAAVEMALVRLRRALRACIEGKLRDGGLAIP